jgi:hypothetical protein
MKSARLLATLAAIAALILTAGIQPAFAKASGPILFGTTGACNNASPGGPCTQTSALVQLDPATGALIKVIGPVGYTVNGLAWDKKSQTLYASTAIGDVAFHGLITIDITTGAGTPVAPAVHNFGLAGADAPIHSITIRSNGNMAGWYDEIGGPTDTFVTIDQTTGIATEFPDTGIDTAANGLSFDNDNNLWNIDTARGALAPTQKVYLLDRKNGKPVASLSLTPPTMAALGDFNPITDRYYGLKFNAFSTDPVFIEVVDLNAGTVTQLGQTVGNLHTLAFAKKVK